MADNHPISAFDLALEAAVASPNGAAKAQVSEGCGDSSSNASNTAVPADGGLLAGPSAAAVPPAVDLGAGAAPMDRDALARMWGAQFDSLELDGEWLDRLDMGFDLSDFAPQQHGQQDAAAAAAAAAQRSAGAGAGPSSEAADGLVPSMGDHHQHHHHNAYDMTAFDADVAAYAALDDFSAGAGAGGGGFAVPSLGALVHPALPQPHHQPYGGFAAGGDDLKKPQQQQPQQQPQQPQQQQQQQLYGAPPAAAAPYGALPPQPQQPAYYQPQQQQQQYAAAPTQYAPPQYHMQQQYAMPPPPPVVSAAPAPAPAAAHKAAPKAARLSLAASRPAPAPVAAPSAPLTAADANALLSRAERVARFRVKRLRRSFKKTIRYESRRAYAEVRPRIKGRFATKEEVAAYRAAEAALREGRQDVVLPPFFAELAGAIGGGVAAAQAQAAC
jgi:hypothetical protein